MNVSFVIPARNEAENVGATVRRIQEWGRQRGSVPEIVVVDDHSTDGTWDEIERLAGVKGVRRTGPGGGIGFALKAGTQEATGEFIIWTMADGCDSVETYTLIVEALSAGADMAIASRHVPGGSRGDQGALKAFLSRTYSMIASLLLGAAIRDGTNAFRGFRRHVFQAVTLSSDGFAIAPELTAKAHVAGFKVCEVPTLYRERRAGTSKFRLLKVAPSYIRVLLLVPCLRLGVCSPGPSRAY